MSLALYQWTVLNEFGKHTKLFQLASSTEEARKIIVQTLEQLNTLLTETHYPDIIDDSYWLNKETEEEQKNTYKLRERYYLTIDTFVKIIFVEDNELHAPILQKTTLQENKQNLVEYINCTEPVIHTNFKTIVFPTNIPFINTNNDTQINSDQALYTWTHNFEVPDTMCGPFNSPYRISYTRECNITYNVFASSIEEARNKLSASSRYHEYAVYTKEHIDKNVVCEIIKKTEPTKSNSFYPFTTLDKPKFVN